MNKLNNLKDILNAYEEKDVPDKIIKTITQICF